VWFTAYLFIIQDHKNNVAQIAHKEACSTRWTLMIGAELQKKITICEQNRVPQFCARLTKFVVGQFGQGREMCLVRQLTSE